MRNCHYIINPPVIQSFEINLSNGSIPFAVTFTVNAYDSDGSIVSYRWDFDGDGNIDKITSTNTVTYTYNKAGTYYAKVTVVDDSGFSTLSSTKILVLEKGDVNADMVVDLKDAVLSLKAMTGAESVENIYPFGDSNGDGRIGLEDAVFILKKLAEMK